MIYAITAREIGMVKIGYSRNPRGRIFSLRVNMPFELAIEGVLEGGRDVERELHLKFSEHHVRGEWFKITPEIEQFIASMPDFGDNPKSFPKQSHKTAKEADIERLYLEGRGPSEIAKIYGVSRQRIDQIVRNLGLPKRVRSKSKNWEHSEKIAKLAADGLTAREISENIDIPPHWVRNICHALGVSLAREKRTPESKTMSIGHEVVEAYLQGEDINSIARRMKILPPRVYDFLRKAGVSPNRQKARKS